MILDMIIALFERLIVSSYRTINDYVITNFLAFAKGFEVAIVLVAAVIFLLLAVGVMLRRARSLPKSYFIQVTDLYGMQVSIDGVRQEFATYDAAESYARFYQKEYQQYRFKVMGNRKMVRLMHTSKAD